MTNAPNEMAPVYTAIGCIVYLAACALYWLGGQTQFRRALNRSVEMTLYVVFMFLAGLIHYIAVGIRKAMGKGGSVIRTIYLTILKVTMWIIAGLCIAAIMGIHWIVGKRRRVA